MFLCQSLQLRFSVRVYSLHLQLLFPKD